MKKFKVVFLWGGRKRNGVKVENMKGESALGMEVRDDLPEITGRERASYSGGIVCAKILKQKTGGLRN